MNAIIHRNYHIQGPSKIAIFDNRVEIFSPGNFPGPLSQNLCSGFTYLRNSSVCKIFREMGLIENFGLGFITTFTSYEKAGLKNPEVIEGENFVKCILPRRVPENIIVLKKSVEQDLDAILNLFSNATEIHVADVINVLSFSRPTATRKLSELVKKGLIKKIGRGRGVRYYLVK
jgi:ATP-dependent DNA helicase RecG